MGEVSKWKYSDKYCIYHNDNPGDMADPTSIFLSIERPTILTIYYDAEKEIVGCIITKLIKIK